MEVPRVLPVGLHEKNKKKKVEEIIAKFQIPTRPKTKSIAVSV
jgi:hypothetical protein